MWNVLFLFLKQKQNKIEIKKIANELSKMDATAQRLPELEEELKRTVGLHLMLVL